MSLRYPATWPGRVCAVSLVALLAIGVAILACIAIQAMTGCVINEAGTGSCRVLGVEMMGLLATLFLMTALGALVTLLFLVPVAALGGLVCLARRRW